MKMLVAALIGGVVLAFLDVKVLMANVTNWIADPGSQALATTAVAAFLGVLWGWLAKGMLGEKKD